MSHVPNIFSPPGTPLPQRTVGELVAERPGRSRVFQAFNIDFCCQGARTLAQACEKKGVSLDAIVQKLEAEALEKTAPSSNPAELPLHELVDYIVEKHHGYLRDELPRLHQMAHRVAQVHGGHTASLIEVYEVFCEMANELDSHMMKEEQILFPAISSASRTKQATLPLDGPIARMMHEHEETGAALEKLRALTNAFQPPPEACNTYRALFAGLADLEDDVHTHIHLENSVLFPGAKAMAMAMAA